MTWFKVDDSFYSHPKVLALRASRNGKGAIALWTLAGSWCSQQLTEGRVPRHVVAMLGASRADAETLVAAGLWVRDGDVGYAFHDWLSRNPSRASVEAKRGKTAERVARWRERNAVTKASRNGVTNASCNASGNAAPDPTRPDPINKYLSSSSADADPAPSEPKPKPDRVAEVFDHWRAVMGHPRAKLDPKRRRVIAAALKLYSLDDCKAAIDGCRASPFHMGENDRRERYDGIDLIFRSADKIDGFIAKAPASPAVKALTVVRSEPTDDALERARQRLAAQRAGVAS